MSDWKQQYEAAAEAELRRWQGGTDAGLLAAVRRGQTGDYYTIWYALAQRPATAAVCWTLYEVLRSERPYLDRYHCAAALLTLLRCTEFTPVALSAGWPAVPANLLRLRELVVAAVGEPAV
ncbi:MAG: hypothetical protein IT204_23330 [Fimbriimonadaceae bacterium]|nr:hypothetical protein [Fimbriimonadaceae bacterium]